MPNWPIGRCALSIVTLLCLVLPPGCAMHDADVSESTDIAESEVTQVPRHNRDAPAAPSEDEIVRDVLASSGRIFVPNGPGWISQGVGVWLADGAFLTAAHVLLEGRGQVKDVAGARLEMVDGDAALRPFERGYRITGNTYHDVAYVDPHMGPPPAARSEITLAHAVPSHGDPVYALLMSQRRGNQVVIRRGTMIATSMDSQFFAVSGVSMQGDSGGPVFDANGRVIGVVVSHGRQIGIPFAVWRDDWNTGFRWQWWEPGNVYQGDFILCSRAWGRR